MPEEFAVELDQYQFKTKKRYSPRNMRLSVHAAFSRVFEYRNVAKATCTQFA